VWKLIFIINFSLNFVSFKIIRSFFVSYTSSLFWHSCVFERDAYCIHPVPTRPTTSLCGILAHTNTTHLSTMILKLTPINYRGNNHAARQTYYGLLSLPFEDYGGQRLRLIWRLYNAHVLYIYTLIHTRAFLYGFFIAWRRRRPKLSRNIRELVAFSCHIDFRHQTYLYSLLVYVWPRDGNGASNDERRGPLTTPDSACRRYTRTLLFTLSAPSRTRDMYLTRSYTNTKF